MAEDEIVDAVVLNLAQLGYPNALRIREGELLGGYVDLIVLPQAPIKNGKRLVLVEAEGMKREPAEGAEALGQLIKYYCHATKLSEEGLLELTRRAQENTDIFAQKKPLKSRKLLMNADSQEEAERFLTDGKPIDPSTIDLILAFGDIKPKLAKRLHVIRTTLRDSRHNLDITIIQANGRGMKYLDELLPPPNSPARSPTRQFPRP